MALTEQEAGWKPEPSGCLREKINLGFPVRRLIIKPTALFQDPSFMGRESFA